LSWQADKEPLGFFDAKGLAESILNQLGLKASFENSDDERSPWERKGTSSLQVFLSAPGPYHRRRQKNLHQKANFIQHLSPVEGGAAAGKKNLLHLVKLPPIRLKPSSSAIQPVPVNKVAYAIDDLAALIA
jgi:hypothetical protein